MGSQERRGSRVESLLRRVKVPFEPSEISRTATVDSARCTARFCFANRVYYSTVSQAGLVRIIDSLAAPPLGCQPFRANRSRLVEPRPAAARQKPHELYAHQVPQTNVPLSPRTREYPGRQRDRRSSSRWPGQRRRHWPLEARFCVLLWGPSFPLVSSWASPLAVHRQICSRRQL